MLHDIGAVANIAADADWLGQVGYRKGQVIAFVAAILSKINELHFAAGQVGNLLTAPACAAAEIHNDICQLGIGNLDKMGGKSLARSDFPLKRGLPHGLVFLDF